MRFTMSCNEEYCKNLEDLLKPHGLKSIFLKNILQKMVDDSGIIPEGRIKAVIINDFSISFDKTNPKQDKDNIKDNELDKMREFSKSFAEE